MIGKTNFATIACCPQTINLYKLTEIKFSIFLVSMCVYDDEGIEKS